MRSDGLVVLEDLSRCPINQWVLWVRIACSWLSEHLLWRHHIPSPCSFFSRSNVLPALEHVCFPKICEPQNQSLHLFTVPLLLDSHYSGICLFICFTSFSLTFSWVFGVLTRVYLHLLPQCHLTPWLATGDAQQILTMANRCPSVIHMVSLLWMLKTLWTLVNRMMLETILFKQSTHLRPLEVKVSSSLHNSSFNFFSLHIAFKPHESMEGFALHKIKETKINLKCKGWKVKVTALESNCRVWGKFCLFKWSVTAHFLHRVEDWEDL